MRDRSVKLPVDMVKPCLYMHMKRYIFCARKILLIIAIVSRSKAETQSMT